MVAEPATDRDDRSLGDLVASIRTDFSQLIRGEIELAKAELRSEAKAAGAGAALAGIALLLVPFAIVLFSGALVIVINNTGITLGWSFTIVGGGYALLVVVLAVAAKSRFGRVGTPKRTTASVQRATKALRSSDQP